MNIVYKNKKSFYRKIRIYNFFSKFKIKYVLIYNNKSYNTFSKKHPKELDEELKILDIINISKRKDKYSLIYDYACDYLDNEFSNNNFCQFKENMCISNRNKPKEYQVGSCCTRNYTKETCKYFNDNTKRCSIKCISCKLFTCPYLSKKGIKYRVNDIVYLKYFLSFRQKLICYTSYFMTKEEIISKWRKFYKIT